MCFELSLPSALPGQMGLGAPDNVALCFIELFAVFCLARSSYIVCESMDDVDDPPTDQIIPISSNHTLGPTNSR